MYIFDNAAELQFEPLQAPDSGSHGHVPGAARKLNFVSSMFFLVIQSTCKCYWTGTANERCCCWRQCYRFAFDTLPCPWQLATRWVAQARQLLFSNANGLVDARPVASATIPPE